MSVKSHMKRLAGAAAVSSALVLASATAATASAAPAVGDNGADTIARTAALATPGVVLIDSKFSGRRPPALPGLPADLGIRHDARPLHGRRLGRHRVRRAIRRRHRHCEPRRRPADGRRASLCGQRPVPPHLAAVPVPELDGCVPDHRRRGAQLAAPAVLQRGRLPLHGDARDHRVPGDRGGEPDRVPDGDAR